ncbi:MAG: Gfo/Idh/MocA family oxidoreductase, partial [Candidatus Omnitrophica bacterium]|nr:Gfo/Idh/MocA family oxidoreductase [Candidatus Omnitrophota bacterium]
LVAVCDKDLGVLSKFANQWKIEAAYTKVTDLLNMERFDVISLCTPTETHFRIIRQILKHENSPKVLLCEKPICLEKEHLEELVELSAATNTQIFVNHIYRFQYVLNQVKDILRNRLKDIISVKTEYYGGFINNGVHAIDTLRMLLGGEFKVVSSQVGQKGRKNDVCMDAKLKCSNTPRATLNLVSFDETFYQLYEMEIRLIDGRIRILDFANMAIVEEVCKNKVGEKELKIKKVFDQNPEKSSLLCMIENVVSSFKKGNKKNLNQIGIEEAVKTMNVLWSIKEKG